MLLTIFFNKKKRANEPYKNRIVSINGSYITPSSVLIDKKSNGDFYCRDEIVIDTHGDITGNVTTHQCVVKGKITGNILCLNHIIIKKTAIINGEITTSTVEIESGAVINGCIKLQKGLNSTELSRKIQEASLLSETISPTIQSTIARDNIESPGNISPIPSTNNPVSYPNKSSLEDAKKNLSDNNTTSGKWW